MIISQHIKTCNERDAFHAARQPDVKIILILLNKQIIKHIYKEMRERERESKRYQGAEF